jgi:hypothetical protein
MAIAGNRVRLNSRVCIVMLCQTQICKGSLVMFMIKKKSTVQGRELCGEQFKIIIFSGVSNFKLIRYAQKVTIKQ